MRRFLFMLLLASCTPVATAPTPAPTQASVSTPAPASPVTAAPTVAPTPTPAPSPTPAPTPEPTAAPTLPPQTGPVRNSGQTITADLPRAYTTFIGEGGPEPAVVTGTHWRLNGSVLAGADIKCTRRDTPLSDCLAVRILTDKIKLRNGVSYELVLDADFIGSFVAQGLVAATPHVVSLKATQHDLTVTFDRPMLHAGDCGLGPTWSFTTPGTIERMRASTFTYPPPLASYTSSNAVYAAFLASFISQAELSADCRTVQFGSGWGAPSGTFDVTVSGVQDIDGNVVQQRTVVVSIEDEGPPKLMFAQLELQTAEKKVIRVAYSEPMDEESVTDPERYYLNSRPIPPGTKIECAMPGCTWVRLTFAPSAFVYGAENVLSIVEVRDLVGNAIVPAIATSGKFQVH